MYISSMTGFARVNGVFSREGIDYSWFWEIKSVNGKSLELKAKLPLWLEGLSQPLKSLAGEYLNRGNIYGALEIASTGSEPQLKINEILLQKLTNEAVKLYQSYPGLILQPSASDLLNIRGVTEIEEVQLNEEDLAELQSALLESFAQACEALQQDRRAEGEKITSALRDIMLRIEQEVHKAAAIAKATPEKLKQKLQQQIAQLLEPSNQISEERLAQEIVLYVNKADTQEEVDRLKAHIKTAEELLSVGGAVGRRLDFLCQELNREANTICSKSGDAELTNHGMELKALIERFREQVQNIE